jgi:hypothetical protein
LSANDIKRFYILNGIELTSLMKLNPSWEAANCAVTQELRNILQNPKVHYRVHKIHPLAPTLSQINPIHPKIHFNIVHPPTPWSSQWSLPPISYMHSSPPPLMLHALPISSSSTRSFEIILEVYKLWTLYTHISKTFDISYATSHTHGK